MDLLFKREQSNAASGGVNFKLWGKIELDEDEKSIVSKYKFDQAILIFADQPGLLRKSIFIGIGAMVAAMILLNQMGMMGALIALAAGIGAGYWWYHQKRETIYVKDLLHGRHFNCDSVVELARKEAWLGTVVSFLRQVMESAKHWDGTERHTVEPLPKDEARQVIIKGL
ncbi:hypothetical protein V8J82_13010 [Gymnodinialimonas sp. 2305UL16-5]|uniref:hypothetical protein n=1 Tax=Gymnodinialimonas mytili TaxID=3126503 RepID=UPI0030AA6ED2